jgi:hypothetical protein
MLRLQVVPRGDSDAYKLVRTQVTHEAQTWFWANRGKTRLKHRNSKRGYIEVAGADGVLLAEVHPHDGRDLYLLTEKFVGRLTAWFPQELAAINIQFEQDSGKPKKAQRAKRRRR